MAQVRASLRSVVHTVDSPGHALTLVNRALFDGIPENRFITLLLATLNSTSGTLTYTNAGHPHGYVFDRSGSIKANLKSTNHPIGISPDTEYISAPSLSVEPGQALLLITDGFQDAIRLGHRADEPTFIANVLRNHYDRSAQDILEALYDAANNHNSDVKDDMTALIVKVRD